MTGLDTAKDHILEAAVLITDADLEIVAEGPNLIIHQPDSILDAMGEWCKKTHGEVWLLLIKYYCWCVLFIVLILSFSNSQD